MAGDTRNIPAFVLRIGLALVILWFGGSQLLSPDSWLSWVPDWTAVFGLTPARVVLFNALFEIATGAMLLLGVYTRYVAALLFLHMLVLVVEIGLSPIGVRDFGLAAGFLALALERRHDWSVARDA